jgi:hypothetical protein
MRISDEEKEQLRQDHREQWLGEWKGTLKEFDEHYVPLDFNDDDWIDNDEDELDDEWDEEDT